MSKQLIVAVILTAGLGAIGGYWYAIQSEGKRGEDIGISPPEQPTKKPLFYRSPMNPGITSPVPAKDEAEDAPAGTVKIDPVTIQDFGVRTARVERRELSWAVQTIGRVAHDEDLLTRLHPKTEGWIEKLFVSKTGESVERDAILLNIYSPKLVTSQQEYVLALNNLKNLKELEDSPFEDILQGARDLVRSARERLVLLDVPEHQIRELEQTRTIKKSLHIHSPVKGIVMNINAREGQYVTPQTELFRLADLTRVWVYADLYEYELPWVQVGDAAEMWLAGIPGRAFRGRVTHIYPYTEAKTRTIKVRLEFENEDLLLKPEMFVNVTLQAARTRDAVVVPAPSVVRSGTREQVFVVRESGKFEPRTVKLGVTSGEWVQILDGVEPGEEIVTSALFLIDSESKLREATAKMLEAGSVDSAPSPVNGEHKAADRDEPHGGNPIGVHND